MDASLYQDERKHTQVALYDAVPVHQALMAACQYQGHLVSCEDVAAVYGDAGQINLSTLGSLASWMPAGAGHNVLGQGRVPGLDIVQRNTSFWLVIDDILPPEELVLVTQHAKQRTTPSVMHQLRRLNWGGTP